MKVETHFDPWEVLGVPAGASLAEAREAYLRLVKLHPPESDPEGFERIRDAHDAIRDPQRRAQLMLDAEQKAPLVELLDSFPPERKFAGPKPWLAVIAEAVKSK